MAACAYTPDEPIGDGLSTTVSYDPYNYDPDDLLAEAQSFCSAYGLSAVYEDETVDPESVRWRLRHYRCV